MTPLKAFAIFPLILANSATGFLCGDPVVAFGGFTSFFGGANKLVMVWVVSSRRAQLANIEGVVL